MESYPGELLVGVFPLIFCVDATLEKKEEGNNRSQFDKFLDTIAITSSIVDDDGNDGMHEGGPMMQKVEEEQSDKEDDLLLNSASGPDYPEIQRHRSSESSSSSVSGTLSSPMTKKQDGKGKALRSPFSKSILSSKKTRKKRGGGQSGPANFGIEISPSFAKALKQGQSFFQRARIVSSSARHGFPPSKDPTGVSNRVIGITGMKPGQHPPHHKHHPTTPLVQNNRQQMKKAVDRLTTATQNRPIDGILPSGWLEKHAAALPSVILVVAQIHHPRQGTQEKQDELLLEALDNLQHSLAPKRRVAIKVVAVIQEGVSPIMADQWSQGMLERLPSFLESDYNDPETVLTLVEERELKSVDKAQALPPSLNNPKTSPLPNLHQSVRRSSLRYYKDRSREIKNKLIRLRGPQGVTNRSPILMPLLIRYCFKAAIFYEFQWKQDKSLKYMVEAHRLVESYYNYLLFWKQQQEIGAIGEFRDDEDQQSGETTNLGDEKEEAQLPILESSEELGVVGEGVEMSLPGTASTVSSSSIAEEFLAAEKPPVVAEDMIHQCRKIADWLNFKILQMCMVCHDKSGTIAASVQWQRHAKTFCCPRRSFLNIPSAPWLDWSYVAQQRVVISQLLERYPPRALGDLCGASGGDTYDEDLIRCSSWRTYQAAAEALLKTGHLVKAVVEKGGVSSLPLLSPQEGVNRIRYVGCIDHEGLRPSFVEESQKSHTEIALNCALRGISLYEKELAKLESDKKLVPWSRSGARLYYLAGGALLALDKHSEAIPHLEKATKLCQGWNFMESLVRRLLVECYEKQNGNVLVGTAEDEDGSRMARTSFLLESYFNAGLSGDELAKSLKKLIGMSTLGVSVGDGGDRFLQWHCDFVDDDVGGTPTPPFSFGLTFPSSTHGTPGNKIKANVWLKSNLKNSVCINRMSVMSFLGPLSVPFDGGSITIHPNKEFEFETEIALPLDLNDNDVEGIDNDAGDTSGNGSVPKPKPITSRPKTGGFTAAGGSRYGEGEKDDDTRPPPWSIRCLGGKTLRCEGMILTFSVLSSTASDTFVKLAIGAEQPESPPNTKRTVFDENNYVSSAWKRPLSVPLRRGPRSLRLLSPIAKMTVTNITADATNGKALEGTVNRVVLKLKAADNENCENVVITANFASTLTSSDGEEKVISQPDDETESEDTVDMMNPRVRAPVLVKPDPTAKTFMTDFGYILPCGWALACKGQGEEGGYSIVAPSIKAGDEIYACFDVYRPTSQPIKAHTEGNQSIVDEMTKLNDCECETEINISIKYNQQMIGDDKNVGSSDATSNPPVSLEHDVNVIWTSPMSIGFSSSAKDTYPSGNQHSSNMIRDDTSPSETSNELILIDGRNVFTKGILESNASTDGLDIEIDKVQFADTKSENTNCEFELLSGLDDDGTIYKARLDNQSLRSGSKMSFAWMTKVNMDMYNRDQTLTAPIGTVSVHWQPSMISLSQEVSFLQKDDFAGKHGPLQLERAAVCSFSGPLCHIESAPFEVIAESLPDSIKVAAPFEVKYSIRNKTPMDQELKMILHDTPATSGDESSKNGFLIGGDINRTTSLGPFESHLFSYITVPMKVGRVQLPAISISSKRYKTWIIRESLERRQIFVQP